MQVLIVKLSSLGDLFHALPAVHNVKVGMGAEIDWVTQREFTGVVKCFTDVRHVVAFPRQGDFPDWKLFVRQLRSVSYDIVIDLQGLLKSALVTRLARGARRIGPSFHREGSRLFYSDVAGRRNRHRHAVEQNMDIVRHLGLERAEIRFPVKFPERTVPGKRPRVAVFPLSRWETKNWPAPCFARLIAHLQEAADASVYVLGSQSESEACVRIAGGLERPAVNLAGKTSLVETGGLLAVMDLVIGNDSGPVHMAAALGVPTLALFGPTDPARTGPYGKQHRVVVSDYDCRPCFSRKCRRGEAVCLSSISPERVGEIALEMLAQR